jgi:hypothetical protein
MTITWGEYYRKWKLDNALNRRTFPTAVPCTKTIDPNGTP